MKDHHNILELIHKGESETLEFKNYFNDQVIETIAAFSNTTGGTILIGIDSREKVTNVTLGKETIKIGLTRSNKKQLHQFILKSGNV